MTKHVKPLMAVTIPCALALTACGEKRPVLTLPPANLAVCEGEPLAPALPERSPETQDIRDELTLDFILALRGAGGDCRAKVKGLAEWIAEAKG